MMSTGGFFPGNGASDEWKWSLTSIWCRWSRWCTPSIRLHGVITSLSTKVTSPLLRLLISRSSSLDLLSNSRLETGLWIGETAIQFCVPVRWFFLRTRPLWELPSLFPCIGYRGFASEIERQGRESNHVLPARAKTKRLIRRLEILLLMITQLSIINRGLVGNIPAPLAAYPWYPFPEFLQYSKIFRVPHTYFGIKM